MASVVRPRFVPPPYQDAAESGRLIIRDGSTASVRLANAEDRPELRAFFERLSPETRRQRFGTLAPPDPDIIARWCDNDRPRSALTLVVYREGQIIASASYFARDASSVEVAFTVADEFRGKGLGTLLLERLALLAVRHGFSRLWALTHADNRAMLEVFRESGYDIEETLDRGEVVVDLSALPSQRSVERWETRDRISTIASLVPFFRPRTLALIGASRDPCSIGHRLVEALRPFQGRVYLVNPKAAEIDGRATYASVRNVPEGVDLAIIAVPRELVLGVVDDCAARGVRGLVVITAGFAEVKDGQELQRQLVEKSRRHGMRLIGPNCMGVMNTATEVHLNATFDAVMPPPGRVAMLSQSGALGLALLGMARQRGLGLSTFVSVGNKADVSGNDLIQYWEDDPVTGVILLYLESFGNPRRFARLARRVSATKPIIALKGGRSQAGGRAAGSHTASLAAPDTAVEALFRQTGVIRAQTLEEMFDLATALACQPLPRGRRVAILTNAGGPGILCADACEMGGLKVSDPSAATKARLAEFLPAVASLGNPVDMIASASAEHFRQAIEVLLASPEFDILVVIYIPVFVTPVAGVMDGIVEGIRQGRTAGSDKPVFFCNMGESEQRRVLDVGPEKVPCFAFPEAVGRILSHCLDYSEWREKPAGIFLDFEDMDLSAARAGCVKALDERGSGWLSASECRMVMTAAGLPVAAGGLADTPERAVALADTMGYPVAVKLASTKLVHKTELGGVHLGLPDAQAVRSAFERIREALREQPDAFEGVLVQPMLHGGVEVMVGVAQDPLFGPVLAFGLGGIHVEILKDACFRITPLTDRDAAEMVRSIRGFRLLEGYRGHPPADLDALQELLLRVSRLVEEVPQISELDLNPVFAFPPGQGCLIVDARIKVGA